jgi:N-carbamoylputrescine amidase
LLLIVTGRFETMKVALISEVFHDDYGRLADWLRDAQLRGAELAVLPEIPLNPWSPASKTARDDDAEATEGPRHRAMSQAARAVGIGLVGGAIVRDAVSGRRHNTALIFDALGALVSSYRKVHLPDEEGFWEPRHYEPGDALPRVVDGFRLRLGIQICSDINRPQGSHLLGAMGAEVVINPRATEAATFARWKTVFMANALTSGAYVLSVARPRPEFGVPLGGPSFAVAPTGDVLIETTDPLSIVDLDRTVVEAARKTYPGYLATRADLYAQGWESVRTTRLPRERE